MNRRAAIRDKRQSHGWCKGANISISLLCLFLLVELIGSVGCSASSSQRASALVNDWEHIIRSEDQLYLFQEQAIVSDADALAKQGLWMRTDFYVEHLDADSIQNEDIEAFRRSNGPALTVWMTSTHPRSAVLSVWADPSKMPAWKTLIERLDKSLTNKTTILDHFPEQLKMPDEPSSNVANQEIRRNPIATSNPNVPPPPAAGLPGSALETRK